jgi:hypothetical protein
MMHLSLLATCCAAAGAHALYMPAPISVTQGVETFVPAHDPRLWYTGRTMINPDGSRSFDWEGTQLWINVEGASYVKMVINATNGMAGRFSIEANGVEVSSFFVDTINPDCDTASGIVDCQHRGTTEYLAWRHGAKNSTIRAISILEPGVRGHSLAS